MPSSIRFKRVFRISQPIAKLMTMTPRAARMTGALTIRMKKKVRYIESMIHAP